MALNWIGTVDQRFCKLLAKNVFNGRPKLAEKQALRYIARMRMHPSPNCDDFLAFIKQEYPRATLSAVTWAWRKLKDYFDDTDGTDYSPIESLANIPSLIAAFKAASYMDQNVPSVNDNEIKGSGHASEPSIAASSATSPIKSSGRSNTAGSSSLSSTALASMRSEFDDHFNAFPEESDKKELKAVLVERPGEQSRDLSESQKLYLALYNKGPNEIEELLDNGWRNVAPTSGLTALPDVEFRKDIDFALRYIHTAYSQVAFHLPNTQSESWFLVMVWGFLGHFFSSQGVLEYQPGEFSLKASALRKNKARTLESKQGQGRKVDGVVAAYETRQELCVIEAARADNGPNGTKALTDTRKLAKSLKDMHDHIRSRTSTNVSREVITFGLRIAASTISFYSLRQRRGRFYQLTCDACVSLPPAWKPSGTTTTSIITVLALLLRLKAQLVEMADNVTKWTNGAVLIPDTTSTGDVWASTLSTPPSSPRLSPKAK
ncbi:hypothetical protein BGW41_000312 [Actinomortierella wolfii]|nr:hypothetical protein BGW41_000312 [Actinomortierella wolfii]